MRTALLRHEQSRRLPLHGRGYEHRARLGEALNARGDVGRLAEHLARGIDHDWSGIESDARRQRRLPRLRISRVEGFERALDRERGANSAFGVVLLRLRIAEERHQPVAEFFEHVAAKPGHGPRGFIEIGVNEAAPILRIEPRCESGRPDQIAKHDGDRAALGGELGNFRRRRF
jgi:hypothetical protein